MPKKLNYPTCVHLIIHSEWLHWYFGQWAGLYSSFASQLILILRLHYYSSGNFLARLSGTFRLKKEEEKSGGSGWLKTPCKIFPSGKKLSVASRSDQLKIHRFRRYLKFDKVSKLGRWERDARGIHTWGPSDVEEEVHEYILIKNTNIDIAFTVFFNWHSL